MKLLIVMIFLFSSTLFATERTCLENKKDFSHNEIKSLQLNAIPQNKSFIKLSLTTKKDKSYVNEYYCMKKKSGFLCVGDDDSGKFLVKNKTMEIFHLNMGNPDKEMFNYLPSKPAVIELTEVKCNAKQAK